MHGKRRAFKDFKAELLGNTFSQLSAMHCLLPMLFSLKCSTLLLCSVTRNNYCKTCHQTSQEQTFRNHQYKQIGLQHPADFAIESQNS